MFLDDKGLRDDEPKPCCLRMQTARGIAWCAQDDGHVGPHIAPTPRTLPANAFAPGSK